MKSRIRIFSAVLAVLFIVALIQLSIIQVVDADRYRADGNNQRQSQKLFANYRGPIIASGSQIARSIPNAANTRWQRVYPEGELYAAVTGFLSPLFGLTGIERYENSILSGEDDRLLLARFISLLRGTPDNAGAVVLAIDPAVQAAARLGLGGKVGAAVAIDPQTGALLALYSAPSFDPNAIAQRNANRSRAYHQELVDDPARPLLNRATSELYPPGSTFKVITAAAALESGKFTEDSKLPSAAEFQLPESVNTLKNADGKSCLGKDEVTLKEAFATSCNTAFAWLGIALGESALRQQAEAFGFGQTFSTPLPVTSSSFPNKLDRAQTALSAIGQFEVKATAMQMALTAATIANGGQLLNPQLVSEILSPDLTILQRASKQELGAAITPSTAKTLTELMVAAVNSGTGSNAQIAGTQVAGKTGTAETQPNAPNHAWFIGFAPATNPTIAVAVVVEASQTEPRASGNATAAPIARAMMQARLTR